MTAVGESKNLFFLNSKDSTRIQKGFVEQKKELIQSVVKDWLRANCSTSIDYARGKVLSSKHQELYYSIPFKNQAELQLFCDLFKNKINPIIKPIDKKSAQALDDMISNTHYQLELYHPDDQIDSQNKLGEYTLKLKINFAPNKKQIEIYDPHKILEKKRTLSENCELDPEDQKQIAIKESAFSLIKASIRNGVAKDVSNLLEKNSIKANVNPNGVYDASMQINYDFAKYSKTEIAKIILSEFHKGFIRFDGSGTIQFIPNKFKAEIYDHEKATDYMKRILDKLDASLDIQTEKHPNPTLDENYCVIYVRGEGTTQRNDLNSLENTLKKLISEDPPNGMFSVNVVFQSGWGILEDSIYFIVKSVPHGTAWK